ncbi:MAG TPA: sulfopyruvate decarboxylase subunit alpha [Nitrospirales bacterium]|nr:sulfopyruvate decarboxylase subunit alpha [Nitrospirales bacterium]HIA13939.1 sulfopyruvate decarboxylase subunit alpha [Nitrospirales bacterium]HIB54484.1 sulfopyruvate decarboxylase subunit alpha [Nitrospirales bacterium]HIC05322.1 sulfopyruvate decarboxylase subunit alpha [Nitrospirales bacterium]HIN32833.1 sulfopyruvate decarboxylase subunit alpha [Nitrospirales bacterium]
MTSTDVVQMLVDSDFNFYTGVPDSMLAGIIAVLTAQGRYVSSVREDEAVGIAAGAFLGGKQPVVLMQNSGLGNCLNALTSLNLIYAMPCLLLISWRGYQGNDAPEHLVMGEVCTKILDTISIPSRLIATDTLQNDIGWARDHMKSKRTPVALMLTQGVLA